MRWGTQDAQQPAAPWGRGRLAALLCGAGLAVVVLVAGFGYGIYSMFAGPGTSGGEQASPVLRLDDVAPGESRREAIAAAPMLEVEPGDAKGGSPAGSPGPTVRVPAARVEGPVGVPTGYPQSPEGAIGQLSAIATTVLQSMSIQSAHDVYDAWTAPGAEPAERWELVENLQAFMGSKAGRHVDETTTSLRAVPVGAQVKGTDGDEWVLACVLLDVTATVARTATIAYGYCAAMQWTPDGRWVIDATREAAKAPSTWPETDAARQAGWRTWEEVPS